MKIIKIAIIASILLSSININTVSAAIITIEYSGTVNDLVDTGSYSTVNVGERVNGSLIYDTSDLYSIEGSTVKKYIYSGAGTYGSFSTVNNGVMGSNTTYVGIENDFIDEYKSVYDYYYVGGASDDLVWDQALDRPVSGTQFFLLFFFNSDTFNNTDLDFETLLNTPNPVYAGIGVIGYDAAGQLYEATATLDSISSNISAVPIPATLWLFGSGLFGLLGIAKRKIHAL